MDKRKIEEAAYELLRECGFDLKAPVDVIQLAKTLGFAVGNIKTKDDYEGIMLINENDSNILGSNSNRVIGVDADQDFNKKRFIIAHELGHYKMEYNGQPIFAHRDKHSDTKRCEEEERYDFFAACLLMPKEGFNAEYENIKDENLGDVVKVLSETFKVPKESTIRRLQELEHVRLA